MKYQELLILLPCHSLEDFPIHHEGDEAAGLLASWSALWHPALIAAAGAPSWRRVDDPPEALEQRLLVIPQVSLHELPTGFAQRAKDEGALVVRAKQSREEILKIALEALDGGDRGVPADLAEEFLSLGYAFLQVELLTRQMRYASNLDELHFNNMVERAAEHAVDGDADAARNQLAACFDILSEERDHYYAVDSYFLDITLTAATTLGEPLREELDRGDATSLLLSASDLERMETEHPETLASLRRAIEEDRACVIGGEFDECRWPMMSLESMRSSWLRAASTYARVLNQAPKVYFRRTAGLSPVMPMLLESLGYSGAIHATLDDGRFPQGVQVKTRWESKDGAVLDAIARPPLDATRPETYLGLAHKLGETMDSDHVATVVLAHWPGQGALWLEDLRRAARFNAPLGKFLRADQYFEKTDLPGNLDRFEFEQYRTPYLRQSVIRKRVDPISSSIRYWRRRHAFESAATLHGLAECVSGRRREAPEFAALTEAIDAAEAPAAEPQDEGGLDASLEESVAAAARRLAEALPRSSDSQSGVLVLNPQSTARRNRVDTGNLTSSPPVARPVFAVSEDPALPQAVVDAPSFGFTWITAGDGKTSKRKKSAPLAEAGEASIVLRNEFLEAIINTTTGTLSGLYAFNTRGNRLSQQLAMRTPTPRGAHGDADAAEYSVMAADECRIVYCTTTEAVVECRGRLLDQEGSRLAGFTQRYTIGRGQRVLGLAVDLEIDEEPKSDPWNSYYACRFAWADETSPLYRTVHQLRSECESKRFEAPHYIEIDSGDTRTTILTGGLPFHRRTDFRVLDSLLVVRGETQRSFQLGLAIDPKSSLAEAIGLLSPTVQLPETNASPSPASSWLFHLNARNVIATHFESLGDGEEVVGFRARFLETQGVAVQALLSAFKPIGSARKLSIRGEPKGEIELREGQLPLRLAAHEWIDVEARWA